MLNIDGGGGGIVAGGTGGRSEIFARGRLGLQRRFYQLLGLPSHFSNMTI
jgi:hypothetical protein